MIARIVEVKSVSKIYGSGSGAVVALNNVNVNFERGEFTSLHGPSGSGKSTLLNLIGGLDRPTQGEISIAGVELGKLSESELAEMRLRRLGFIFQSYNLIPVLSALENVEFIMQIQGVASAERKKRAISLLAEVGLADHCHRRPSELSGGQQQRVAVARAILSNPEIVLADEPTANLDSASATNLLELMKRLNQEKGITFIFSTHDQRVMSYATRLIGLRDGQIVSDTKQA